MMIQSMTGFASKNFVLQSKNGARSSVSMSLKTLNSRFFETNCKVPHVLSHLETELIKQFKKKFRRGYVHFIVHMSNPGLFRDAVEPSFAVVENYLQAIRSMQDWFEVAGDVDLGHVLSLPNIFVSDDRPIDDDAAQIILSTVQELMNVVVEERIREGKDLHADLTKRCKNLKSDMDMISERSKVHIEEHRQKVQDIVEELGGDESALADVKKTALYASLDKIDIHEEITRFQSHLANVLEHLDSDESENGKRLDFIFQELAREINTISAKCSDVEIGTRAINVKVEVEKAREQIQNVV